MWLLNKDILSNACKFLIGDTISVIHGVHKSTSKLQSVKLKAAFKLSTTVTNYHCQKITGGLFMKFGRYFNRKIQKAKLCLWNYYEKIMMKYWSWIWIWLQTPSHQNSRCIRKARTAQAMEFVVFTPLKLHRTYLSYKVS